MRKKIVIANWKMNGQIDQIKSLLNELTQGLGQTTKAEVIIMPPAIYLPLVSSFLSNSPLKWGAQNCYPCDKGAFTGEISAVMLADYAVNYVLVGHSERRRLFKEGEIFLKDKFHHLKEHDMIPVLCVGETLEERMEGRTKEVIKRQLLAVKKQDNSFANCVIAYEPVWAIGTGKTAAPEQVQEVHSLIRAEVAKVNEDDAKALSILYGGSVNEKNAESLFAMQDVDGGLVGGASLNAQQFLEILKCIN